MPTYQQHINTIAARTETSVAALWAAFEASRITRTEFNDHAAALIEAAGTSAGAVADAALAARLTELSGEAVGPLGLAPTVTVAAELAAITVGAVAADAVRVAARNAVRQAGQDVWAQGLVDRAVAGWRRVTGGSGCPVCSGLAQADFLPSYISMYRHRGCGCHPDPVLTDPQRVAA